MLDRLWDPGARAFVLNSQDPSNHTQDAQVEAVLDGLLPGPQADRPVGLAIDGRSGPTGQYGRIVMVPTISRFFGIVIAMYFDDHGPPHFHARHAEGAAKVRIDTLEPIESTLGRRQLRFVLAWAELHQAELLENWRLARDGETLSEIDPLQ